ncbi:MAG: M16 family metallopeptidase [Chitinophagaceae bacterium]
MRKMAFQQHPYQWMTIGKELSHIEKATIDDVKAFFFKHYRPVNAILVVAGNVTVDLVKKLAEKWFGPIPMGEKYLRKLPVEPTQTAPRKQEVFANVPLDALVKTWHMESRLDKGYYVADLITEILAGGASSRLYQQLVKEQKLFSSIDCYHFGSTDNGLLAIDGKLVKGVKMEDANNAVEAIVQELILNPVAEAELEKVKNKTESSIAFEDMGIMNRAASIAYYELLGDATLMNTELERYHEITVADIQNYSKKIFNINNSNTLFYHSKQ